MINFIKNKIYKLLKKSEKWTKTDMVYLAKGGFWLGLGQGVSSISSFLLAIAFANLIPKEIYGSYKYVLSIVGVLSIFTLPGMGSAIAQAVAKGCNGLLIPSIKARIKWGFLGGLACLVIAGYYYFLNNTTLSVSFLIAAAFLPVMDPLENYSSLLQGKKLFNKSTQFYIINQIVAISVLLVILFLTKNLYFILFAYFSSWTLMRFISFKIVLKNYAEEPCADQNVLSYGKHLSLMSIIVNVASYMDRLLIFHFLGAAEVAIYSVAIAPSEQLKALFKNIIPLSMPKFASRSMSDIKKSIWRKLFILLLLLSGISLIYILSAPFLFEFLFPKYSEAVVFSQIYSLSLITYFISPLQSIFQAHRKIKHLYLLNSLASILQIIFLFVGIYYYGLMGVIFAQLLYKATSIVLSMIIFKSVK